MSKRRARALGRVTDPLGRSGEGVAFVKDRDVTWISDARTVYVRTGDVGKIGERP